MRDQSAQELTTRNSLRALAHILELIEAETESLRPDATWDHRRDVRRAARAAARRIEAEQVGTDRAESES